MQVLVVMGSASDREMAGYTRAALERLGITHELVVASAHRTPAKVAELASKARERGVRVIIAMAGGAAHLAGVIAAHTTLPVIAVPLAATPLAGFDALLASVQMPPGIPVATVAIGRFGAENAAMLAAQILAVTDEDLRRKLDDHRAEMARKIEEANREINAR